MDYIHTKQYENDGKYAYEHRIPFQDETVLVFLRPSDFLVPGFIVNENYRITPEDLKVSEVRAVEQSQISAVEETIQKYFEPILKSAAQTTGQTAKKITQFNFW
ncbi:MAG: hypothetical protein GXP63_03355 [DPANN group archaeon]|nr:hypothetical protein [DPANN group archaeon]